MMSLFTSFVIENLMFSCVFISFIVEVEFSTMSSYDNDNLIFYLVIKVVIFHIRFKTNVFEELIYLIGL